VLAQRTHSQAASGAVVEQPWQRADGRLPDAALRKRIEQDFDAL